MEKDRIYQYEPLWGEWYVKGFIGEGTFGRVYLIERNVQGTVYKAAAKLISIPTPQQKNEARRNFGSDARAKTAYFKEIIDNVVNEINLLNRLSGSGHVVEYKDHSLYQNEEDESWDVVIRMELLTDLRDHFEKSPATVRDIIQMAKDVCTGLMICAKYSVVHRDIKLDNIFVSEHGIYKIGDFGVSRFMGTGGASTVVGTYDYIAPEVIKEGRYDSRVDIYSLGLVLYRLFNNDRMPFMPAYPSEIKMKDREEAYRQRISGAAIPSPANAAGDLWNVIDKACRYDPDKRYPNAAAFKEALEGAERSLTREQLNMTIYPPVQAQEYKQETTGTVPIFTEAKAEHTGLIQEPVTNEKTQGTIPIFAEEPAGEKEGTIPLSAEETFKSKVSESIDDIYRGPGKDQYKKVDKERENTVNNKKAKKANGLSPLTILKRINSITVFGLLIGALITCLAAAAYLGMGFFGNLWHPGWLVFMATPVGLLIYFITKRKNSIMVSGILIVGLISCLAAAAFLTMGVLSYDNWKFWSIIFICIPISILIYLIIKRDNSITVLGLLIGGLVSCLATDAYLIMGIVGGLWHPEWIVFISIPVCILVFYIIKLKNSTKVLGFLIGSLILCLAAALFLTLGFVTYNFLDKILIFLIIPIYFLVYYMTIKYKTKSREQGKTNSLD